MRITLSCHGEDLWCTIYYSQIFGVLYGYWRSIARVKAWISLNKTSFSLLFPYFIPSFLHYSNISSYLCARWVRINLLIMMLQTTNFNQANVCALYNKGVSRAIALDSLTSKGEKKIANNLVVPNICILSLSLSL